MDQLAKMASDGGFTKSRGTLHIEIMALAAEMEPKVAAAVLKALDGLQSRVTLKALKEALETGNVAAALSLMDAESFVADFAPAKTSIEDAAFAGGALAAGSSIVRLTGAAFVFERLNPRLIDWLTEYNLGLIQQISENTREGVRDALLEGMNSGSGAAATARKVRPLVGLTKHQAGAVSRYRKELETFHERQSAKGWNLGGKISRRNGRQVYAIDDKGNPVDLINERRLRDFRYDGITRRAMETGKPIPQAKIDQMVEAYARKYRKHRSEMIARTETLRATNVGVQDAWRQAIEGGKVDEAAVVREWIVGRDERLCQTCAPIPSLNKKGVAMGTPFATPKGPMLLPPAHPACRCTIFIRAD